ncbi:hypothetical protein Cgig2_024513 [Carnegiea gigantea]|uniref:Pectinesterase inhibitor domain-containing protein n=1 Tax=Carnegiea gigantea TaxID=171969 RepID=A0A9Q1KMF9_9CARY|nr:hypothetical protein Cgig2_024513 [Carnegiea gigantea]
MERTLPFIVLYIAAHLVVLAHAQNATIIDQACKQTPNYDLCVSTLNSDPQTRWAKDIRDLATILVLHVKDKATQTRDHIAGLLKDPSMDPQRKQLLSQCMDRYNTIVMNWLRETLEGLSNKDYSFARDSMGSVPTNVELCERSFEGPVKSPISEDSKAMDDLSKMLMEELDYLKYWLTQQDIQQVLAKGNDFMFKYLTFCMQLLKSQDQERACMIKNPKEATYPITSADQQIVRTSVKRKAAVSLDYSNSPHQSCLNEVKEGTEIDSLTSSASKSTSVEYNHEISHARKRSRKPIKKVKRDPSYVTVPEDVKLPRAYMEKIRQMKGREVKLIAQKRLKFSDIDPSLNRLMIPVERILNKHFLTDDEKARLDQKGKIKAKLIDPWAIEHELDPDEEEDYEYKVISMSKWKMRHRYYVYALVSPWNKVVCRNQFVENDVVQVWSFRVVKEDGVHGYDQGSPGTLGLVILRTVRAKS